MKKFALTVLSLVLFKFLNAQKLFIPADTCKIIYSGRKAFNPAQSIKSKSYFIKSSFLPLYKSDRLFITKVINYPYFISTDLDKDKTKSDTMFIVVTDNNKYYGLPLEDSLYIKKTTLKVIPEDSLVKNLGYCYFNAADRKDTSVMVKDEFDHNIGKKAITWTSDTLCTIKEDDKRFGSLFVFSTTYGITHFSFWAGYGNSYSIDFKIINKQPKPKL